MTKTLIIFSTTDGHTQKICTRLQEVIEQNEETQSKPESVTLLSIDKTKDLDLEAFDKIIIGASIRYGKHSQNTYDFINTNQTLLEEKSNAFFTVNMVARKPEKNTVETNPYLNKFLDEIAWQPQEKAVFAGKINYSMYGFLDRTIIRFIMWMTKGPTDPSTNIEFTDWQQVTDFGHVIKNM